MLIKKNIVLQHSNDSSIPSPFFNRDIFEEDNYSPIPITNEEEYKIVISKFPFQDPDLEKVQASF